MFNGTHLGNMIGKHYNSLLVLLAESANLLSGGIPVGQNTAVSGRVGAKSWQDLLGHCRNWSLSELVVWLAQH